MRTVHITSKQWQPEALCKEWEVAGSIGVFFIFPELSALTPRPILCSSRQEVEEDLGDKSRWLMGIPHGPGILELGLCSILTANSGVQVETWRSHGMRAQKRCEGGWRKKYNVRIQLVSWLLWNSQAILAYFWARLLWAIFIQETFIEHLYYARSCARCQGHRWPRQIGSLLPPPSLQLMGKANNTELWWELWEAYKKPGGHSSSMKSQR